MGWLDSLFGYVGSEEGRQRAAREGRDPLGRLPAEPAFDAFRDAWKAGAGLLDLFGSGAVRIRQPVGPDAANRRADVAKVETFLGRTGHLDLAKTDGPTGYYGTRLDQSIRRFQKDSALKVDGLINPGGPTLQRISATLSAALVPDVARASPAGNLRWQAREDDLAQTDVDADSGHGLLHNSRVAPDQQRYLRYHSTVMKSSAGSETFGRTGMRRFFEIAAFRTLSGVRFGRFLRPRAGSNKIPAAQRRVASCKARLTT